MLTPELHHLRLCVAIIGNFYTETCLILPLRLQMV